MILFLHSFHLGFNKISYGDIAPDFCAKDIRDRLFILSENRGKYILICFFDPTERSNKFILNYAQVLHENYSDKEFEILGISNKDKNLTKDFVERYKLIYPIIADEDMMIHQLYSLSGCCGGLAFINKKREIEFYSRTLMSKENIRQIVEKAILGEIKYEFHKPEEQEIFKINEDVPKLMLNDFSNNRKIKLKDICDGSLILTIFSSFCGTCKTGNRVQTLMELREKLKKERINADIKIAFSEPFGEEDIKEFTERIEIPFDKYIAPAFLSPEQKYITSDNLKNDPLTIAIHKRKIIFLEKIGMDEKKILQKIVEVFNGKNQ